MLLIPLSPDNNSASATPSTGDGTTKQDTPGTTANGELGDGTTPVVTHISQDGQPGMRGASPSAEFTDVNSMSMEDADINSVLSRNTQTAESSDIQTHALDSLYVDSIDFSSGPPSSIIDASNPTASLPLENSQTAPSASPSLELFTSEPYSTQEVETGGTSGETHYRTTPYSDAENSPPGFPTITPVNSDASMIIDVSLSSQAQSGISETGQTPRSIGTDLASTEPTSAFLTHILLQSKPYLDSSHLDQIPFGSDELSHISSQYSKGIDFSEHTLSDALSLPLSVPSSPVLNLGSEIENTMVTGIVRTELSLKTLEIAETLLSSAHDEESSQMGPASQESVTQEMSAGETFNSAIGKSKYKRNAN